MSAENSPQLPTDKPSKASREPDSNGSRNPITSVSSLIPDLDPRTWILAAGRLLSQIGVGFTLFYAPIFFVNQVGLSATAVGLGLGSGSVAGLLGRALGGSAADSPRWGRRRVLLLSALISALADVFLALAQDFSLFLVGNLLMGFGIGLYWPATEAIVADVTPSEQHNEAFALVRLADNLGLGLGVVLGGALIAVTGAYRALFVVDGVTYVAFFGVIYWAIAETLQSQSQEKSFWSGWGVALSDRSLLIYALVNIWITGYVSQVQSTLPVYLNRFVAVGDSRTGLSESILSSLFTGHIVLTALCQLPVARFLQRFRYAQALIGSVLMWGVGFSLVWAAGVADGGHLVWAGLALGAMAIAVVAYTPVASSLVVHLAPESLRGVYLSVNSMCWAIGYFIGPPVGGWALDQSAAVAHGFWLAAAGSGGLAIAILLSLDRRLRTAAAQQDCN